MESLPASSPWRPLTRATLVALLVIGLVSTQASATERITIANDEILIARPGSVLDVAEVDVDPSQVGLVCTVEVISQNQASVHIGNDLLITTGGVVTVIEDVEAEPDASVDLSVDLLIGETISFQLRMGPDWVSSLGFDLALNCDDTEPVSVTVTNPSCSAGAETATGNGSNGDQAPPAENEASADDCPPSSEANVPAGVPLPGATPSAVPLPPVTTCSDGSVGGAVDGGDDPVTGAADNGSATAASDCPTTTTVPVTAPPTTVAPTTGPTTTAPPTQSGQGSTPTGDSNSSSTSAPASVGPEVLGLVIERLPATPAAPAVAAAPAYNG